MKPKLTRTEKIAANRLEKVITEAYTRRCSGVEIDIMDISKVYRAGEAAHAAGQDVEAAIVAFVQTIRKN
jgi:hypothetical protein